MPSRGGTGSLLKDDWQLRKGRAALDPGSPYRVIQGRAASLSVHQSSPFKILVTECTLPSS